MDFVNGVAEKLIGSHQGEFKAFVHEYDYQIKKGEKRPMISLPKKLTKRYAVTLLRLRPRLARQ